MALIQKTLFPENLDRYNVFVQDTHPNSRYFNITELPDTFTGGKNAFLIAGAPELVADTLIKIEIKDAAGNIIYQEPGEGSMVTTINGEQFTTEYYEGVSKVVSVYVYPGDTAYGPCTITILGELSSYYDDNNLLSPIPLNWEGQYNVKWQKTINVNPTLANTTKIRFYKRPTASINEIISPIYRIESGSKVNTGINQSFANIKLSNLETFAGDVKRVKVFRTSQGDISDYDLIQDILIESKELLTSYGLTGSVVGNTGIFTSTVFDEYWDTGSLKATLDSDKVEAGVKLSGSGNFKYITPLDLKSTNTYELNLDAFYSASTDSNLGIYVSYLSQSTLLTSSVGTLYGITPTKNLLDTTIPFTINRDYPSASLYFSQSEGEWHLGNISLKLSEDTAFSPDEVSFITTMPSVVGNEDYNFKFEFYDVNNNYVPVAVTSSANFNGGNNNIGGTLIYISSSASASAAQLAAVSSSISGTMTVYSSSADTTIVTLSGSVDTTIVTLSGSVSGSITIVSGSVVTLSGSVSASISSLSSSVSSSNAVILSSSFAQVKNLANGQFSGSFIGDTVIYSPTIGGQQGYIKELFTVGDGTGQTINLDARTSTRKMYIGNGDYNNSNTGVYLDSSGKFSLKDKLYWDGITLNIIGNLNVGSSVPNSVVNGLKALALKDTVSSTEIDAGAVTEGKIGTGAVSNAKIAADAITEAKIATDAVTSGKISANAVVADKIAANAIVADKIATNAITATKISAGAIEADKIAADAITATKISAGAIEADKIAAGAITAGKIAAGAIEADKIAAGAITAGKIAAGAVTADKVDVAGVITAGSIVVGGSPISALSNNSGYQANGDAKTAGSVGGWEIGSTYIASNNGKTIFYNDGNMTLSDGGVEKIKITKDSLTKNSTSATITIPGTSDGSGTTGYTHNYASTWTGYTVQSANSSNFTAQGASIIVNVPYGGSNEAGLSGNVYWSATLSNFKSIQNTTLQEVTVKLYTSGGTLIDTKSVRVYNRLDILGTNTSYTFPYIPGGTTSVAFSGLSVGSAYYVEVVQAKTLSSVYYAWVFSTSISATWNYYGMQSAGSSVDVTSAEEKTSIGVNGMIASSAGGFAQVGPVASVGGTAYSAAFLGNVRVNGEVQASAFIATSDERLKTNIKDIESPLLAIEKLKPKSFIWNNKLAPFTDQKDSFGFIAQEVQRDFPYLVNNIGDNEEYDNVLSLDYNAIIPINTAAIKELLKKIEELEERILELENQ